MDSVEKAIRNALAKGDAEDRAFRERVYRSAFAALDRAAQANPGMDQATIDGRSRSLKETVSRIESEFIPAVEIGTAAPAPATPHVDGPRDAVPRDDGRIEPDIGAPPPRPERREPDLGDTRPLRDDRLPPDSYAIDDPREVFTDDRRPRRARRWFSLAFIIVTLFAALGVGAWWVYQSGILTGPSEIEQPVPNPPKVLDEEDFVPPEEEADGPLIPGAEDNRDWLTIFSPADPTRVSTPADALADIMEEDGQSFLRIRSGASGSAIIFDVGQGVLEQIAGKTAIFNLTVRSEEGQETQIAVECNFGELGDCGRKRYAVNQTQADYLFEIALPDVRPGAGGTLAINTDISNGRKAIDVYEIRVAVTN